MKHTIKFLLLCSLLVVRFNVHGQSKMATDINSKINEVNNATNETGATIENATKTLENAKTLFKELAGKTTTDKNKMTIVVSGIHFNDSNLELLESAIIKLKGTKKVSKTLQSGIITISLKYRQDANHLWNKLPAETRKLFKPVEVVEKTLLLNYIKQRKK
ncbi:MAG: hypothetical protein JST81_05250 [Bacteroidetes bacterium]|nr:hypothetical protein [Bacteroidota bacterium]